MKSKFHPVISKAALKKFRKDFGKNCARHRQWARKIYTPEFGKPPEEFTLDDYRHLAKPNRYARFYLGKLWNQLTSAEKLRVENMNPFLFVAGGEIVDPEVFYAAKLSRLLTRKFHPKKK